MAPARPHRHQRAPRIDLPGSEPVKSMIDSAPPSKAGKRSEGDLSACANSNYSDCRGIDTDLSEKPLTGQGNRVRAGRKGVTRHEGSGKAIGSRDVRVIRRSFTRIHSQWFR